MKCKILNIYNSDVIEFNADYVCLHSGIRVLWIYANKRKVTVTLLDEHYEVTLDKNTIHIKRR